MSFLRAAYVVTFFTGAAGLMYQVAWQRYLTRLLGGDGIATATVLAVFLGGLSAGYVLCGRLTLRVRHVFFAYGLLEAAIGVWALVFPWWFGAVDRLTASWSFAPPWGLVGQGAVGSALLILPPTLCMGGTVPMLTRGLTAKLEAATPTHARVYALNTAGAAAGTLLAGFVTIWWLGLPGTLRLAALVNLSAAALFLVWGRDVEAEIEPEARPGEAARPRKKSGEKRAHRGTASPPAPALWGIAFLSGFAFLSLETVLVRMTKLAIGAAAWAFPIVVTVFIISIAIGAWTVAMRRSIGPAALVINHAWICYGLAVVFWTLDLWPWAAHRIRLWFGDSTLSLVGYLGTVSLVLAVLLLVPAACMGATLPLAFHALRKRLSDLGQRAGTLLAWNALGSWLGGLVGGYVVLQWLDLGQAFLLAVACCAAGGLVAASWLPGRGRRPAWLALGVTITVAVWFPYDPTRMAVGTYRLREPLPFSRDAPGAFYEEFYRSRNILAYRDDPDATLAVVENPRPAEALLSALPTLAATILDNPETLPLDGARPRTILINGKPDSSTFYDRETLRLSAHLPALLARDRSRVLVVGLGTGVTVGELTLYPDVQSIEVAELSPGVVDLLPLFDEATHRVHEDPRVAFRIGDAFRVLRRGGRRWDLVISEPSNPWVTGVDQVFSREFYRLVREHLEPGGLFVQWVQRYATTETIRARVVQTVLAEFPHVRVFHAREALDDLLVASTVPVTEEDFGRVDRLLAGNPEVRASLAEIDIAGAADLLAREDDEVLARARAVRDAGIETLDHPRLHWLSGLAFFRGDRLE